MLGLRSLGMAKTKSTDLEKNMLICGRVAARLGLSEVEVTSGTFSCKMVFSEKSPFDVNKKENLSDKDKETLENIQKERELEEMMLQDPAAYEQNLINGKLTEDE